MRIVSAPELTVQTSLAKLSGDADLRLRGTAMRPVLLGRINIAEGDINLNGTKYHLDRGDVTFANPVRIDPILDMEATTRVRDFDITIGLHGTMEKLTTTYRSDPPLSSDDIIALLAFGRTQEESYAAAGRTTSLGEGAGSLVLGQAINQTVSNRVSKLFGVSSIRINPSVGGAGQQSQRAPDHRAAGVEGRDADLHHQPDAVGAAGHSVRIQHQHRIHGAGNSRRERRSELRPADPEAEEVADG